MIKQCVSDYSNTILPYASLKRGQVPSSLPLRTLSILCLSPYNIPTTESVCAVSPQESHTTGYLESSFSLLLPGMVPANGRYSHTCQNSLDAQESLLFRHHRNFPGDSMFPDCWECCHWGEGEENRKFLLTSSQMTAYFSFCSLAFSRGKPTHSPWYIGKKTVNSLFANIKQLHQPPVETVCLSQSLLLHPASVSHSGIR